MFDYALPEELRTMLKRWAGEFSTESFTEDASSNGIKAWAVKHKAVVQHQDLLVERLRTIFSDLPSPRRGSIQSLDTRFR